MQPIRIFTPQFVFLGEMDDYESLQFTRRFSKPGEFEMHINMNKHLANTLQEGNLIYLTDKKVGVIQHREISRSDSEQLIIKGYSLEGILGRRITIPPVGQSHDSIHGPTETVMKHLVKNNAVQPADSPRIISPLLIGENQGRGKTVDWRSRYMNLGEELENLSQDTLGWTIYADIEKKKWIFDVIEGRNLTSSQTNHPPVIFSMDFDNIKSQTFTESAWSYKNNAYVGGQGEGAERTIVEVGLNESGMNRIETFVDAHNSINADELTAAGHEVLRSAERIVSFESEILTHGPFLYETDWDLGDTVTVQDKKLGLMLDTTIPEIREIYEPAGFRLEATFGNTIPTLTDRIKQVVKGSSAGSASVPTRTSDLVNDSGYVTQEEAAELVQDKSITFTQFIPETIWTVIHNLDKYPNVTVTDSAGNTVAGEVKYVSATEITISFSNAFAGKAFLN